MVFPELSATAFLQISLVKEFDVTLNALFQNPRFHCYPFAVGTWQYFWGVNFRDSGTEYL